MPGITGIISKQPAESVCAQCETMTNALVHEPFYRSGTVWEKTLDLCAGWAAHQGAFADCMPVWNETRDVCLVFSGEALVDRQVVDDLRSRGHRFNPDDASWLVHWYEEAGLPFLEKLNGMFCGVLADLRNKTVVLFNDRFGMNRIYWHESERGFYFSSEAKSLLRVLPETRAFDLASLGEFVSGGCVLQNRTLFTGLRLMPGGSAWLFAPDGTVQKKSYFDPRIWESQPVLPPEEYYERLKATWLRLLPRYFAGREAAALSLTGGVDSRMILACAPVQPGGLACYTFGGPYRDCADVTVSRQVAKICGQPHRTIGLGEEFLSDFPAHVEKSVFITDGTLDPTGASDLYVNRIARGIAPVRVTGLNGGEILRRLIMFKAWHPTGGLFTSEFESNIAAAEGTYNQEVQGHLLSFIAFKQSPWHLYPRLAVERSQLTLRSPYFDNELVALAFQAPPESLNSDPALRLVAEKNPALGDVGTDRATLLHAVPGISTLRHYFQEFTFRAEYAYDYGMPQWLARTDNLFRAFHFERLFLGRHKFYHYRIWYRDRFAKYLKEILLDGRTRSRPYLNGAALERIVKEHTSGRANYTLELHRLLTMELACRKLIESV
jgi:asparagine synthase (glutamine-hydrolysing)